MQLTKFDRTSLARLHLTLTDNFDPESRYLANQFNAELAKLLSRIDATNRVCLDLNDISRLRQLDEIRSKLQDDQFQNALDALHLAERRLELIAIMDDRIHFALRDAKASYVEVSTTVSCAVDDVHVSLQSAGTPAIDVADLAERRKHIDCLKHLASEIRMFNNVSPEWIGELVENLGCRLQVWANEFVGIQGEEPRLREDHLRLWDAELSESFN